MSSPRPAASTRRPKGLVDESDFFDGAWGSTVVGGTSYGVPWYVETRVLYYRTDLAKKAGWDKAPTTWDELSKFAADLKGGRREVPRQPAARPDRLVAERAAVRVVQRRRASPTTSGTEYTIDSPEMTEALDYYKSFFDKGYSQTRLLDPGELENGFAKGTYGSFISGPWHIGLVEDAGLSKDKYAVAPLPGKDSGPGTSFIGGGDLAVFKDAKNRDGAWKFVRWLSEPDDPGQVVRRGQGPAGRQGGLGHRRRSPSDPQLQVFGEQLDNALAPPAVPTWEQVAAVHRQRHREGGQGRPAHQGRGRGHAEPGQVDRHRSLTVATTTTPTATSRPQPTPVANEPRHVDPMRRQQAVAAWVLALPFMVLFLVFTAGPVLASLGMSFTDIRSTDMRSPFAVGFVGLENYTKLLGDPLFQKVMFNTFAYLVLGVPLTMGAGAGRGGRAQPDHRSCAGSSGSATTCRS